MGLIDKIFRPRRDPTADGFFSTLTAYQPTFRTWGGQLYESELVRAAIDARARHISKLSVDVYGSARPRLQTRIRRAPNDWMTWSQFLYRLSTILDMQNTAFIVPVTDQGEQVGYYPVLPSKCELVDVYGETWIRYHFSGDMCAALPLSECGIMTKFQYSSDFFGETNGALDSTMELINISNQGIEEAVKSSATYRFMARVTNFTKDADLAKERQRFDKNHLSTEGGGILLFPNTYSDIRQIDSKPYTVDTAEQEQIQRNVYNYFGVNEDVLQNKALGNTLDAFFNGAIEPFEIQLSEVMTRMTFTAREISAGSEIRATANRLQYMPVETKISMVQQLGDRGMITIDEARALFNYGPLPDGAGSMATIRGEYYDATEDRTTAQAQPKMDKTDSQMHNTESGETDE